MSIHLMLPADKAALDKREKKRQDWLNGGKMEKARLYQMEAGKNSWGKDYFEVQFNPSELSIARSLAPLTPQHPLGHNPDPLRSYQAVGVNHTSLSLTLYFDDASGMAEEQTKKPTVLCREIATLLRFHPEHHQQAKLKFLWGTFCFVGEVLNTNVQYTMFTPGGTPVRAKVSLTISGEEEEVVQHDQANPQNSPNRTKERMLAEGDSLWMLAQREYDDPALWKVIAEANGIRNPRKLSRAAALKVPSIK